MIKCACGDPRCRGLTLRLDGTELWVSWDDHLIPGTTEWATADKLMYVDANTLIALIGEARAALLKLADQAGLPRD